MRRILFSLTLLTLLSTAVYAQSGRNKGSSGKPPEAAATEPSPSPDLTKSSKPSLPKMVDGERIYTSKETDEKAKILKKPIPRYPGKPRYQTRGYVILRVILAADETVKHIEVITGFRTALRKVQLPRRVKSSSNLL